MNQKKNVLWSSISLLIGVVVAILALVRGPWQLALLVTAFTLWGLWVIDTQLMPAWRVNRAYRRKARKEREAAKQPEASDSGLADMLLHHVNYRISDYLKAVYPNARWEWTMGDPARFAAQGGTGRIRLYGVPDFDYADVELDRRANIKCSLIKCVPLTAEPDVSTEAEAPSPQPVDPQVWYERQGREFMERIVADLNSRGHSTLTLLENGGVCIQTGNGSEAAMEKSFPNFPSKENWPRLAKVLEQEGLAATVKEDCITVAW